MCQELNINLTFTILKTIKSTEKRMCDPDLSTNLRVVSTIIQTGIVAIWDAKIEVRITRCKRCFSKERNLLRHARVSSAMLNPIEAQRDVENLKQICSTWQFLPLILLATAIVLSPYASALFIQFFFFSSSVVEQKGAKNNVVRLLFIETLLPSSVFSLVQWSKQCG